MNTLNPGVSRTGNIVFDVPGNSDPGAYSLKVFGNGADGSQESREIMLPGYRPDRGTQENVSSADVPTAIAASTPSPSPASPVVNNATAEPMANAVHVLADIAPTGGCDAPNKTDTRGMVAAILGFHRNIVLHDWATAASFEDTSTFQRLATLEPGYRDTIESSPTITSTDGCHISVTLQYQDKQGEQHCVDNRYDMEYTTAKQRWIIQKGHKVSEPRLCA